MHKNLLIVFAKNKSLGKVKTRLAKTIGPEGALAVYTKLYDITRIQSLGVRHTDIQIYFSEKLVNEDWGNGKKFVQKGNDLGEKMKNAFETAFSANYKNVICIGADLPDINSELIESAFNHLNSNDFVFGPAEDGGYYLVGTSQKQLYIFENKPWSTTELLALTLNEIELKKHSSTLLGTLNDIDTIEDLKASTLKDQFETYYLD